MSTGDEESKRKKKSVEFMKMRTRIRDQELILTVIQNPLIFNYL